MKLTQKILRFLDPASDELRMQVRDKITELDAHTEDLQRTVIIDGEKIAALLRNHGTGRTVTR